MSSKPFITEADVEKFLGMKKPKANTVPTIYFHLPPPLTPEEIAKSVTGTGGPWRLLSAVAAESIEEKRAKRLADRFDMTPIPVPYFEPEDEL